MSARFHILAMSALLFAPLVTTAAAMQCTVCHSKNPAMVKMHKSTQAKGISCFDCHKIGEKLMGKGEPKDKASQLKRRSIDAICKECHS